MSVSTLYLKRNEERRLRAGHLWVFSNEVDTVRSPLAQFEPGQEVRIMSSADKVVAMAYVNPKSLICARVVSRTPGDHLDETLVEKRLRDALALRERLFDRPYYRLVFGEGDYLPGLILDRHGDVVVAQVTTAGMERLKDAVASVVRRVLEPRAMLWRNDVSVRALEGLPGYVEPAFGEVPEDVLVEENGVRYHAPLAHGQKTGWFHDQRSNRAMFARYASGRRVLDVFSYVGGFGVAAAVAGASEAVCIDASATATGYVDRNARENGVADRVGVMTGEADKALEGLIASGERFDVISLDPPAFIKRRKDMEQGGRAYVRYNKLALKLLADDGILLTNSCSQHLSHEDLRRVVLQAGNETGVRLQILEQGHQASDHPIHPAMPETEYLKAYLVRARRGQQP